MMDKLRRNIIDAAVALCQNSSPLPDGNSQFPGVYSERLGDALSALVDNECQMLPLILKLKYAEPWPGLAQVALHRVMLSSEELAVERCIDAVDAMYLAIFDEVIIPGSRYLLKAGPQETRYIKTWVVDDFMELFGKKYAQE